MSEKIGIIADDFTGANDTGVQLAKKGYLSCVQLMQQHADDQGSMDAWIVDTDSRSASKEAAYSAVFAETRALKEKGITQFYKKMDSTLRGNIGTELQAMEEASDAEAVVIAPAFPALGRTTAAGCHYVEGVPLTETEFAKDPKTPVQHSFIPYLLKPEGSGKTIVLTTERLYSPDVLAWLAIQLDSGFKWFVCDAEREEDLAQIASVFRKLGKRTVWAGSAGLMNHLTFGDVTGNGEQPLPKADKILTVSGSLSERTKAQLEALGRRPGTLLVEVDPAALVKHEADAETIIEQIRMQKNWDTIALYVASTPENRTAIRQLTEAAGMNMEEAGKEISIGLGILSKRIMEAFPIEAIILTGGDTAKGICSVLGAPKMDLLHEVEPGLPLGRLHLPGKEVWAVTKAGGFGHPGSFVNAVKFLKGEKKDHE